MKYINFERYKFSTILKNANLKRFNVAKLFKTREFTKFSKYFEFQSANLLKLKKYKNKVIDVIYFIKKKDIINFKFLFFHLPASIIFFTFLYLTIPTFYKYDQSSVEKLICNNQNVSCKIKGKVNYSFYPTPRLKISNVIINHNENKKSALIKTANITAKLSFKNLLAKDKHKVKKKDFNNFEISFNLKKYNAVFSKISSLAPASFKKGKIIFYDNKKYVSSISDAKIDFKSSKNLNTAILKGKFLDENIYVKWSDNKVLGKAILKMPSLNLNAKVQVKNDKTNLDEKVANVQIKKHKYRFTGVLKYKDNKLNVEKSNLRNDFLDGRLSGEIIFFPYFDFNLDLNLNSLNFTKLYNRFLKLDEKKQKNLFKVNKKINGKLGITLDKIYSNYNLVKSLESQLRFNNGSINVEQMLISLGKLGAADIIGSINTNKKYTTFKYESNVFVDNKKKFISKFGIYNKKNIPLNFFISGNFDLINTNNVFYEISDNKKLPKEDINFIEKEFNYFMLSDGYKNLFNFSKLKDFIKSINSEDN